jgi:chemotaxis protein CheX
MCGEEITELDDIALSALGEIANMITGNAATRLSAEGYRCNISPPVMIEPAGSRFTIGSGTAILVTFTSDLGEVRIRVSLYEVPD